MQTIYIDSFGKGGNTSSGNWHIHYHEIKTDYKGRPYTAFSTFTKFRKRDMLQYIEQLKEQLNVIMPA